MNDTQRTYVVAEVIGGWNQTPLFRGTEWECQDYLDNNPALSYGNNVVVICPEDEYEIDYI